MKNKTSKDNIVKILNENGFYISRMLSGSKSFYCKNNPNSLVLFNANIITDDGKIWYGDVDITKEGEKLKKIANETKTILYVLYEMDCRFETEKDSVKKLKERAIWNTNMEILTKNQYLKSIK